jgi:hypothetical protein
MLTFALDSLPEHSETVQIWALSLLERRVDQAPSGSSELVGALKRVPVAARISVYYSVLVRGNFGSRLLDARQASGDCDGPVAIHKRTMEYYTSHRGESLAIEQWVKIATLLVMFPSLYMKWSESSWCTPFMQVLLDRGVLPCTESFLSTMQRLNEAVESSSEASSTPALVIADAHLYLCCSKMGPGHLDTRNAAQGFLRHVTSTESHSESIGPGIDSKTLAIVASEMESAGCKSLASDLRALIGRLAEPTEGSVRRKGAWRAAFCG